MPTFAYQARTREGDVRRGQLKAESERDLREALRGENLFLTRATIQKEAGITGNEDQGPMKKKVKLRDMVVMSRQFATLVRAGIPVVETLQTLSDQTENPTLVRILRDVRIDVLSGSNLSDAMRKHPGAFSELYVSLVEAGETGGILDKVLDIAAENFDREAELRERVKAALTYPILVVLAAIGTVTFMLLVIVPTFAKVYTQFNAELPAITQSLVTLSDILLNYTLFVVLGLVMIMMAIRQYNRTDQGRHVFDQMKIKVLLVGPILRKIAVARFAQTFSHMTHGGVPILKALNVAAATTGNVIIKDSLDRVAEQVKEGELLSKPLEQTGQFPPMVTRMIASGEQAGNLPEMLDEINHFYKRDIEYSVDRLTKIMEPLMTVIVGAIVLFVLLALYYPVFTLTKVIKR